MRVWKRLWAIVRERCGPTWPRGKQSMCPLPDPARGLTPGRGTRLQPNQSRSPQGPGLQMGVPAAPTWGLVQEATARATEAPGGRERTA